MYGDHLGGTVRLIFPLNNKIALTAEGGVNETLLARGNDGRAAFGVQFGNMIRPKEYLAAEHALPMEVPRVRYEVLTKRVRTGNDPPVADAGPNQIGIAAGTVQLDGSASYDPDGDPITFQWTQQGTPLVTLVNPNTSRPTFTAAVGQTYNFLLVVKDDHGGQSQARVRVSTSAAARAEIVFFTASPTQITAGQTVTLAWQTLNADSANIAGIGNVAVNSSLTVSPTQTTTYTLTARNSVNDVTSTATVTVGPATGGNPPPSVPVIASFTANPTNISAGQSSTLQWTVQNSTSVSISSIGTVSATGTRSVSPTVTTTYTLTATNATGSATSTATVTVGSGGPIIVFNPSNFIYTTTRDLSLDASGSSSPAGNTPLQFYWTSRGDKAVIYQRTSATTRIYLPGSTGNYIFDLTVTDSKGVSTTQTLTVRLIGQ